MVTVALPVCVTSARDIARTVTTAGLGAVAGAVYRPSAVISPQEMPAQPAPDTLQITTLSEEPVALNCTCAPRFTCAEDGATVTAAVARHILSRMAAINTTQLIFRVRVIGHLLRSIGSPRSCSLSHERGPSVAAVPTSAKSAARGAVRQQRSFADSRCLSARRSRSRH